jgi:hypothetical protein
MKLRIATWNIERPQTGQTEKIDALVARMQAIDADIWILTEAHAGVSPGSDYSCVATTTINNPLTHTPGENRTSIWSRLPINAPIETHDPETAVCADIETPFGPILIYGTVIPYHAAGTKYPYRSSREDITGKKAWQLHYESIALHKADCSRLQALYPNHHFCLGGDLNQNRDGRRWYGTIKGRELLTTTLETCKLTCVTEEDFVARGDLKERSNIDHLCLSEGLSSKVKGVGVWDVEYYAPKKRLSDHNGVWVDLITD